MRSVILSRTEDMMEMTSLLETLGVCVVKQYVQKKDPHPTSFLGPGKIDEILAEVKEIDPDLIIVNDQLKPSQHHFLEMKFGKECVDRIGVILRIFAEHAHTPEAIAQVQLARLRYEQPFLREWIHKAKSGERPGFLAGGAYAIDAYYEHAKTHMRRIESRLQGLSKRREVMRERRHDQGFTLVSLAGYTNAGKSALMNALCSSEVEVSSQLFSSLSTTTRRVEKVGGKVLAIDTVGFIRDLPPDLIDAFKSTLEEVFFADLILLVLDVSEENDVILLKLQTSLDVLLPVTNADNIMVIGAKSDLVSDTRTSDVETLIRPLIGSREVIMVSSLSGRGLDRIRKRISGILGHTHRLTATLPMTDENFSLLSKLYDSSDTSHRIEGDQLVIDLKCNPSDVKRMKSLLVAAGGRIVDDRPDSGTGAPPVPVETKGAL